MGANSPDEGPKVATRGKRWLSKFSWKANRHIAGIIGALTALLFIVGIASNFTSLISFVSGKNLPDIAGAKSSPASQPTIVVTVNQVTRTCNPVPVAFLRHTFTLNGAEAQGLSAGDPDAQAQFLSEVQSYLSSAGELGDVATLVNIYAGAPTSGDTGHALALDVGAATALRGSSVFQNAAFQSFSVLRMNANEIALQTQLYTEHCAEATP